MAGQISLECTFAKANVPVLQTEQLAYLLIEVKPTNSMKNVQMPLNLSLVLDHSGSMSGEKLRNLKEAAKLILGQMQPHDYVSITVFDDLVELISPSQPVNDAEQLKRLIDGIQEGGGTEMSGGMKVGLEELKKAIDPRRVSRMLLLTDGQTFGDEEVCQLLATEAGTLNISITALGLGSDWNSELLDVIAQKSSGMSDFIDTPDKIHSYFQSTLQSMQATVINNAQLLLRFVKGVTPKKAWRAIPRISELNQKALSERDVQFYLGELEKDQGQAIVIEILLPPRQAGHYRIAQAEISYDVPADHLISEKERQDLLITYTTDAAILKQYTPRIMNLVEKLSAFNLQTRALHEAKEGNLAGATQKLRAVATRLLDMGETDLANAAQEEAERLDQGQQMSELGTKKLQYSTRKLTQRLMDELSSGV